MSNEEQLRKQLAKIIDWDEARAGFAAATADLSTELQGRVPQGLPHSPWQLLEHIRIALWDIVEFTRDARHKSPEWPGGYWPKKPVPPDEHAWDKSVKEVEENMAAMRDLILDAKRDLFAPLPHGSGQTLFREALLAGDHNAYHIGQLVLTRKALGAWKG